MYKRQAPHHRTGDQWVIYPMYDFAHPLEDAFEGVTHSVCTMEFEDHRPLYDWFIENCECKNVPHQYEFARLNLTNTVMSKRYLKKLVDDGVVSGWDDPRMPTLSGVRRRGYTPAAIRDFCERIGVAKAVSEVDVRLLEHCVREDLNAVSYTHLDVYKRQLLHIVYCIHIRTPNQLQRFSVKQVMPYIRSIAWICNLYQKPVISLLINRYKNYCYYSGKRERLQ